MANQAGAEYAVANIGMGSTISLACGDHAAACIRPPDVDDSDGVDALLGSARCGDGDTVSAPGSHERELAPARASDASGCRVGRACDMPADAVARAREACGGVGAAPRCTVTNDRGIATRLLVLIWMLLVVSAKGSTARTRTHEASDGGDNTPHGLAGGVRDGANSSFILCTPGVVDVECVRRDADWCASSQRDGTSTP
jgi:hypothetical protein